MANPDMLTATKTVTATIQRIHVAAKVTVTATVTATAASTYNTPVCQAGATLACHGATQLRGPSLEEVALYQCGRSATLFNWACHTVIEGLPQVLMFGTVVVSAILIIRSAPRPVRSPFLSHFDASASPANACSLVLIQALAQVPTQSWTLIPAASSVVSGRVGTELPFAYCQVICIFMQP